MLPEHGRQWAFFTIAALTLIVFASSAGRSLAAGPAPPTVTPCPAVVTRLADAGEVDAARAAIKDAGGASCDAERTRLDDLRGAALTYLAEARRALATDDPEAAIGASLRAVASDSSYAAGPARSILSRLPGGEGADRVCTWGETVRAGGLPGSAISLLRRMAPQPVCAKGVLESAVEQRVAARAAAETARHAPAAKPADAAIGAYLDALDADAALTAARTELVALVGPEPEPAGTSARKRAESFLDAVLDWLRLIGIALAVLALIALVILALLKLMSLWERSRKVLLATPKVSGILRPRVQIEAAKGAGTDEKAGVELTSLIRAALSSLGDTPDDPRTLSGPPQLKEALEGLASKLEALPKAGKLASATLPLMRSLLPRPIVTVTVATLPADPAKGVGLVVSMSSSERFVSAADTLWANELTGTSSFVTPPIAPAGSEAVRDYYGLALPAAAWVLYRVLLKRDSQAAHRVLGTYSWRSFALARMGAHWRSHGDPARGNRLLLEAVEHDPLNIYARLNLGRAYYELGLRREGRRLLQDVIAATKQGTGHAGPDRPQAPWVEAVYQLCVFTLEESEAEREAGREAEADGLRSAVEKRSREAVKRVAEALYLEAPQPRSWRDRLVAPRETLQRYEALLLPLLAHVVALRPGGPPAGRVETNPPNRREHLLRLFNDGGVPTPEQIIDGYLLVQEDPGPGARYNLACHYAQLADRKAIRPRRDALDDLALDQLRIAVLDPAHRAFARRDSSLAGLRKRKADAFARALGSDVARLPAIGAVMANALQGLGVRDQTLGGLLDATRAAGRRADLARSLGLPPAVLMRWASLAELGTVLAVGPGEVALLDQANAGSLALLAAWKGKSSALASLLASIDPGQGRSVDATTLEGWIQRAVSAHSSIEADPEPASPPPEPTSKD